MVVENGFGARDELIEQDGQKPLMTRHASTIFAHTLLPCMTPFKTAWI